MRKVRVIRIFGIEVYRDVSGAFGGCPLENVTNVTISAEKFPEGLEAALKLSLMSGRIERMTGA